MNVVRYLESGETNYVNLLVPGVFTMQCMNVPGAFV